jgi:hypothetical protein
VRPILEPMAVRCEPATLDLDSQRLLAVWAIKTVYLLEPASRQRYPGTHLVEGYQPSTARKGNQLAASPARAAPSQSHRAAAAHDGVAGLLGLQHAGPREPGKHRALRAVRSATAHARRRPRSSASSRPWPSASRPSRCSPWIMCRPSCARQLPGIPAPRTASPTRSGSSGRAACAPPMSPGPASLPERQLRPAGQLGRGTTAPGSVKQSTGQTPSRAQQDQPAAQGDKRQPRPAQVTEGDTPAQGLDRQIADSARSAAQPTLAMSVRISSVSARVVTPRPGSGD